MKNNLPHRPPGITGPADVHKMGIDKYNAECRAIVMRYSEDWESSVTRLGRWIDFKNVRLCNIMQFV